MEPLTLTYGIYTAAAVLLTAGLARALHRNGRVFLDEVFADDRPLAAAINSLLVIGFYLLNLGYAFVLFRAEPAADGFEAFETLMEKLGALLLSLGVIHFLNLAVFWRIRTNAQAPKNPPPQPPTMQPPPPPPTATPVGASSFGPIAPR